MATNPAVLFYTSDFLTGVSGLTMEERGQYITLLCLQHQKGRLTKKDMSLAVGKISVDVLKKFIIDEEGLYYQQRMEIETNKRNAYTESRRQNRNKDDVNRHMDGHMKEHMINDVTEHTNNHMSAHMENENIYINNINNIQENNSDKSLPREKKKAKFVPPTLDEVRSYCAERGNKIDARQFFDYFSTADWVDARGQPVRNWKQKAITWEKYSSKQGETPAPRNGTPHPQGGAWWNGEQNKNLEPWEL